MARPAFKKTHRLAVGNSSAYSSAAYGFSLCNRALRVLECFEGQCISDVSFVK